MTENNNPNEPQMLSDEDLAKVAGGYASWDIREEDYYRSMHDRSPQYRKIDYETWIADSPGMDDDSLRCRMAWIAAGRPNNRQFTISNEGGPVWSCSFTVRH